MNTDLEKDFQVFIADSSVQVSGDYVFILNTTYVLAVSRVKEAARYGFNKVEAFNFNGDDVGWFALVSRQGKNISKR